MPTAFSLRPKTSVWNRLTSPDPPSCDCLELGGRALLPLREFFSGDVSVPVQRNSASPAFVMWSALNLLLLATCLAGLSVTDEMLEKIILK